MKILSLTMSAFSTYKDVVHIDFEHFIDHGLYLISGPTGSGKTTIFDAITFALYGKASGSERQQAYFRSDYASNQDETYVEMRFLVHNEEYLVKRMPSYIRPGYKTPKVAKAYLTYQGKTIEGIKEVDQKIIQLLGVDVNQFKQIVMIAQGEFRKLIYASSEEREKVLRHIFHTENYMRLEQLLKDTTKEYKDQYHVLSKQLITEFNALHISDHLKQDTTYLSLASIEAAIKENKELKTHYQQLYQTLKHDKQIYDQQLKDYYQQVQRNKDITLYQQLQLNYEQLLTKQPEMLSLQQCIKQLKLIQDHQSMIYQHKHLYEQYQQSIQDVTQLQNELHQLLLKQSTIESHYQQVPLIKEQLYQKQKEYTLFKEQYNQFDTYYKVKQLYKNACIQHETMQKDLSQLKIHINKLHDTLQRDQESIDTLPKLKLELKDIEQQEIKINERKVQLHDLSEYYDQYKLLQDKHYELSQTYQKVTDTYQQLVLKYQQEDELFKCQQAGILASTLKEHEPCPVCGSYDHPHLATLPTHVLSAHELDLLSQKVEIKRREKEEAYQSVMNQHESMLTLKEKVELLKQQLSIDEELSKEVFIRLLADITSQSQQHQEIFKKHRNTQIYLEKLMQSHQKDELALKQHQDNYNQLLMQLHEREKQIVQYQQECQRYEQLFDGYTKDSLKLKLDQLHQYIIEKENYISDSEKEYVAFKQQTSLKQNQLSSLLDKQTQLEKDYLDIKVSFDTFKHKYFHNDFDDYYQMLPSLSKKEQQYQDYYVRIEKIKSQLDEMIELKDQPLIDLIPLKEQLNQLNTSLDTLQQQVNHEQFIVEDNDKIIKSVHLHYQKNQDLFENYTLYQDLYDQASGKNSKRMSFERYVLSYYFEQIIQYANIELLKLTHGRYELYRKAESKGSKQQGLDLSVLDYETGVMRDVESLSGGETFKAALALALGLSSMIQSYAGGIELNTLFIDEGFGSLDKESLDVAMNALLDLKNDHKIIGIISHVDELKERISAQILVHKSKQGSYITMSQN